jgi:hypothetical protein
MSALGTATAKGPFEGAQLQEVVPADPRVASTSASTQYSCRLKIVQSIPVPVKALAAPMNMVAETAARRDLLKNMVAR